MRNDEEGRGRTRKDEEGRGRTRKDEEEEEGGECSKKAAASRGFCLSKSTLALGRHQETLRSYEAHRIPSKH